MPIAIVIVLIVGVIAAVGFYGMNRDSATEVATEPEPVVREVAEESGTTENEAPTSNNEYTDGEYSATVTYATPKRTEHTIVVTLSLANDTVDKVNVTYDGGGASTKSNENFDQAYKPSVVGKKINDISLSRVGGSSLTTKAFNNALAEIKQKAS